jgi:peptidoglycan/LPS O-acetylase OafA/YrhL
MRKYKLSNIQMLRAVAALGVLLHHLLPHYHAMGGEAQWANTIGKWGFVGVDIFFVISGYIMAYTTYSKPRTFDTVKTFLRHRFSRIYLGYWPFFFAMAAIIWTVYPSKWQHLDVWGSFWLTQPDMFKLVLPVSWTLTYELYFYVLFALTLLLPFRISTYLFGIAALLVIASTWYHVHFAPMMRDFFTSPLLLEFFGGFFLFALGKKIPPHPIVFISLLLAVFACYAWGIVHDVRDGWMRVATYGTGALALVALAIFTERKERFRAPSFLVELGDASYTLYLSHLILLELYWMSGLRSFFEHTRMPLLGAFVFVLLAVIFSLLYYRHIEKPLYRKAIGR